MLSTSKPTSVTGKRRQPEPSTPTATSKQGQPSARPAVPKRPRLVSAYLLTGRWVRRPLAESLQLSELAETIGQAVMAARTVLGHGSRLLNLVAEDWVRCQPAPPVIDTGFVRPVLARCWKQASPAHNDDVAEAVETAWPFLETLRKPGEPPLLASCAKSVFGQVLTHLAHDHLGVCASHVGATFQKLYTERVSKALKELTPQLRGELRWGKIVELATELCTCPQADLDRAERTLERELEYAQPADLFGLSTSPIPAVFKWCNQQRLELGDLRLVTHAQQRTTFWKYLPMIHEMRPKGSEEVYPLLPERGWDLPAIRIDNIVLRGLLRAVLSKQAPKAEELREAPMKWWQRAFDLGDQKQPFWFMAVTNGEEIAFKYK